MTVNGYWRPVTYRKQGPCFISYYDAAADRAIGDRYLYGLDWLEKEINK